jgi:hypothetical protein
LEGGQLANDNAPVHEASPWIEVHQLIKKIIQDCESLVLPDSLKPKLRITRKLTRKGGGQRAAPTPSSRMRRNPLDADLRRR